MSGFKRKKGKSREPKCFGFVRKDRVPMPMESVELNLIDFRGCFENDDGGHRTLARPGLVSFSVALAYENWQDGLKEEQERLSGREWVPHEEELAVDIHGKRLFEDIFD